jgi:hypothetical protein
MKDPTPEQVERYWRYMLAVFKASVVDKRNSFEMKALAMLLGKAGILDPEKFLAHYATTIGRRIYVPFDIGVPTAEWSLWGQIVVCAHECQHIHQLDWMGPLRFAWKYVGSSAGRAHLEAEAYRCQLELHHWRTGEILPAEKIVAPLKAYNVSDTDIEVAATIIRSASEAVRRGAITNHASHAAIEYLDAYAHDLRQPSN